MSLTKVHGELTSQALLNLADLSEDGTLTVSTLANVAWLHSPDGLSDVVEKMHSRNTFLDSSTI